jgi:hypothetical protein
MLFAADEVRTIEARAVATVDGLAVLANALVVAYCATAFVLVRKCLAQGQRWTFWTLAVGTAALQVASYAADSIFFGRKNLLVTNVSSLLLVVGFALTATALFKKSFPSDTR